MHYTKITGTREEKLKVLEVIDNFTSLDWQDCPSGWQDKFLPQGTGDFFSWPALKDIFPWQHSGVQFKRRWPIGETQEVLIERWKQFNKLDDVQRKKAFYETGSRKIHGSYADPITGKKLFSLSDLADKKETPDIQRYAFRSFDREYAFLDTRFADRLRPDLISTQNNRQIYVNSLLSYALGHGPAASITANIPDLHHFRGSFGGSDIIALWRDNKASEANITNGLLAILSKALKLEVTPEDLLAYCYAILANPGYVTTFWEELSTPGPRIPITKKADVFSKGVEVGRKLIWLHTYGERFVPKGKAESDIPTGKAKCLKAIPDSENAYPEEFFYDPIAKEIHFGAGCFGPVAPEIWEFEVSGLKVVHSWLAYRRKSCAGKRSSALDEIRPLRWTAQMTDEFLELLWVLEHTVAMFPDLQKLLEKVVSGKCFLADELPHPTEAERKPPEGSAENADNTDDIQIKLF